MRNLLQTLSIIILLCSGGRIHAQSDRYLHFDGNNDFAELPNASQYFTGASGISMTGWFCSDGLGYGQGYFGFRGPGNNQGQMYVIEINNGTLECRYISTSGFNEYVSPNGTVQALTWQHVAWTYNGTSTRLYINGVLIGSTPSSGTFTSTTRSFGIGKSIENGFNFVFGGRIDEVSVWRKGLTQIEILDIMANELTGTEADLELYYKMNQGIPGGNNTGVTQLISEVGAGTRDANLMNFSLNGATSNFNISSLDPSFTVSDYCAGTPNQATITGDTGGMFTFNNPPSDFATIDPITGSITGGMPGTSYTIRYTTPGNCAPHEIHTVTVLAPEDASFTLTDYCIGDSNSAQLLGTTGGTFSLDPPPGDGATIDPITGSIIDGVPGSTYTVLYETSGFCSASSTETVIIGNAPQIINIVEECAPDEMTYTVSFEIIEGDSDSYSVLQAGTLTGNLFESDPIASGTAYTFTVPDSNGCGSAEIEGEVTCTCPVTITLSGDISICEGSTGDIVIELTGDGPWTVVYEIDGIPQPLIESPTDTYILEVTSAGSYQFLSATDNNCTSSLIDTGPVIVDVIPVPTASITGSQTICAGEEAEFEVILTGTGPWDIIYFIDAVAQPTVTPTTSPFLLTAEEQGLYTIAVVNDSQCTGPGDGLAFLTVNDLPTANISGDQYFCSGDMTSLSINLSGNPDYTLTYSIDGGADLVLNITDATSFDLITNQAGTYDLVSISDANCIGDVSGSVIVSEHPLPTAAVLPGSFTICEGVIQDVSISLTGTADWTVTYALDGVPQAPLISSVNPLVLGATSDGMYTILSVSDAFCENVGNTEQVTIEYHPPISITYSEDVNLCIGGTAQVWAEASGGLGTDYTYTWDTENLVGSTGNNAIYSPSLSGTVQVIVNEECDYNQSFGIPITVNLLPPVTIGGELQRCGAGLIELINSTASSFVGDDCTWLIEGEPVENCGSLFHFFELGTYGIGLSMTSPAGCYNEVYIDSLVQVDPQAEAGFIFSPEDVTTTDSKVFFVNQSNEADVFLWSFGTGEQSFESDPSYDFGIDQGVYTVCLLATNEFGCSDSICQTIRLKNDLLVMIPNSFTPDNDGVNDYFFPVLNGIDENDYQFSIFDRQGHLLFETLDVADRWNGSYREELGYYAADAWFTWKLVVKELGAPDKREFTGTVLMLT